MTQKEATMPYRTIPPTGKTAPPEPDPTEWEPYGTCADPAHDLPPLWSGENLRWFLLAALGLALVVSVFLGLKAQHWYVWGPLSLGLLVLVADWGKR